jgi:hypothetical protein
VAIKDIFSKRTAPLKTDPDVLSYDTLPEPLLNQIVHIWITALGRADDCDPYAFRDALSSSAWNSISVGLARELGIPHLAQDRNACDQAVRFLTAPATPTKHRLDLIELAAREIDTTVRANWWSDERRVAGITQEPDDALAELNHRFLEHAIGYQYEDRQLVKLSTTYVHAEIVRPALTVLADKRFAPAQGEFLAAHEAYRHGRYSDCLNEALKAFESTMKIICHENRWPYQQSDTASRLIAHMLDNGIVPAAMQQQFSSLRALLESGTPTVRNKTSGHGAGVAPVAPTEAIARFGLHTAAANITLLAESLSGR